MKALNGLGMGHSGRYRVCQYDTDAQGNKLEGTRRVVRDWFCNLITDRGFEMLALEKGFLNWMHLGNGTSEPAFTDTTLLSRIVSAPTRVGSEPVKASGSNVLFTAIVSASFTMPEDLTVTELGVGQTETGNLFSHALVKNSQGEPDPFTMAKGSFLELTFSWQVQRVVAAGASTVPLLDGSGDVTFGLSWTAMPDDALVQWNNDGLYQGYAYTRGLLSLGDHSSTALLTVNKSAAWQDDAYNVVLDFRMGQSNVKASESSAYYIQIGETADLGFSTKISWPSSVSPFEISVAKNYRFTLQLPMLRSEYIWPVVTPQILGSLPTPKQYASYSATLVVTGGVGSYTNARATGQWPSGLTITLNGSVITIAGSTDEYGPFVGAIAVDDGAGSTALMPFEFQIEQYPISTWTQAYLEAEGGANVFAFDFNGDFTDSSGGHNDATLPSGQSVTWGTDDPAPAGGGTVTTTGNQYALIPTSAIVTGTNPFTLIGIVKVPANGWGNNILWMGGSDSNKRAASISFWGSGTAPRLCIDFAYSNFNVSIDPAVVDTWISVIHDYDPSTQLARIFYAKQGDTAFTLAGQTTVTLTLGSSYNRLFAWKTIRHFIGTAAFCGMKAGVLTEDGRNKFLIRT